MKWRCTLLLQQCDEEHDANEQHINLIISPRKPNRAAASALPVITEVLQQVPPRLRLRGPQVTTSVLGMRGALAAALVSAAVVAEEQAGSPLIAPMVHSDMHALFSEQTGPSMFDHHGLYLPPKNVAYSPKTTTACCVKRCRVAAMLPAKRKDCDMGCELWLHSSSLNWASRDWHPKLEKHCQRDCTAVGEWDAHLGKYQKMFGDASRYHPGWRATLSSKPAPANVAPKDAQACKDGCTRFRACLMQSYPKEEKYPFQLFSSPILNKIL